MKQPEPGAWIDRGSYRKQVLGKPESLGSGRLVQIVEIGPGETVGNHYHRETQEIFYIMQPGGTITIDGTTVEPDEGTLLVCEPGDIHSVDNTAEQPFRILVFKTNLTADDTVWLDDG